MPVQPLRDIQIKKLATAVRKNPTRLTSTPYSTQKDLRLPSSFGSGIASIPELSSPVLVASKKPSAQRQHPRMDKKLPVLQMICEAIKSTGDKKGASVQAIKKFLIGHYNCEDGSRLNTNIKKALLKGTEDGTLDRPKQSLQTGARGFFKLNKKKPKTPVEVKDPETAIEKQPKTKEAKKTAKQASQPKTSSKPSSSGTKKVKAPAAKAEKVKAAEPGTKKSSKQAKSNSDANKNGTKKSKKASNKQSEVQNSMPEDDSDPEKTLKAPPVPDLPSRAGPRRRKLSAPASDTELTLVPQDRTNIIRNRMNFSDSMSMSMMAKETLGKTLKMTASSAKLKKAKRLSLKSSKFKRSETKTSIPQKKTRKMPARGNGNYTETSVPPNSPAETSVPKVAKNSRKGAKDRLRDISADSIIKPNSRKRNPRRKSSV